MTPEHGPDALLRAAHCEVQPTFPGALYCLVLERLSLAAWGWLEHCLSAEERMRANGLRFEAQRQAFIAAHGLVRLVLGQRLSVPAGQVCLSTDGKPRILNAGGAELDVSLAHTEGCVACVVGSGMRVGVDVERAGAVPPPFETWLSMEEQDWLAGLLPHARPVACLDLWCRKEALSKALGLGSAVDFCQLAVPLETQIMDIKLQSEAVIRKSPASAGHGFHIALALLPFASTEMGRDIFPHASNAVIQGYKLA